MGQQQVINILKKKKYSKGLSCSQIEKITKVSSTSESIRRLKKQGDIMGKRKRVKGFYAMVWRLKD